MTTKPSVQSPYDKLIAFCTTTGTGASAYPYYFVRNNRASTTVDATIQRNIDLYSYLQSLTAATIPGFGGSLANKYSHNGEINQILTEMVDYIRCTNPCDHSFDTATTGNTIRYASSAEVVPLQIGGATSGLGRIYTVSEVAVNVICNADGDSPLAPYVPPAYPTTTTGSDSTSGWSATLNPQHWTARVSKVVGSATDPKYVSNLTEPQFLRTGSSAAHPFGEIVGINSITINAGVLTVTPATSTTPANMAFKANPTLSTSGSYMDPSTPAGQTTADGANNWLTPLLPGQRRLQAMLIFEVASPMHGYDWMGADVRIRVAGANGITIDGAHPFPGTPANTTGANSNGDGYIDGTSGIPWSQAGLCTWGGLSGFHAMMNTVVDTGSTNWGFTGVRYNGWSGRGQLVHTLTGTATLDTSGTASDLSDAYIPLPVANVPYRPVSNPFTVSTGSTVSSGTVTIVNGMQISGNCTVTLEVPKNSGASFGNGSANNVIFQTLNLDFSNLLPNELPDLPVWGIDEGSRISHAPDWWGFDNRIGWDSYTHSETTDLTQSPPPLGWACVIRTDNAAPAAGTWTYQGTHGTVTPFAGAPSDVVRSLFAKDGDYRLTAAKRTITANGVADFVSLTGTNKIVHLLRDATQSSKNNAVPGSDLGGTLASGVTYPPIFAPKVPTNPINADIATMGDWDNGGVSTTDGAYANYPDHGNIYTKNGVAPYFNGQGQVNDLTTFGSYFTPNRIMPSPVMFGSLPTGVAEGKTWRTLLFRPAINRPNDPVGGPKDYLFLDLFTMPVVEPYAISEPFSTAGKVNMNYQIVPFTYITRDTGIRAVLGSELVARIPAAAVGKIPNNTSNYCKGSQYVTGGVGSASLIVPPSAPAQARLPINLDEINGTLRQFQDKFDGWNIFRSAAEICDIYLVPQDSIHPTRYKDWVTTGAPSYTTAANSWYGSDFAGVGDNLRERPYADIYPRLTTKSNTFTVHFRVQSLKNPKSNNQAQWTETKGVITGEYRGSTTVERYLDPTCLDPDNNPIIDYATNFTGRSLDTYYQWRTVANNAFAP